MRVSFHLPRWGDDASIVMRSLVYAEHKWLDVALDRLGVAPVQDLICL